MNQSEDMQINLKPSDLKSESEEISENKIVEILEEQGVNAETQNEIIAIIRREIHSGPLPSPEMLLKYNEMPGVVDIIKDMAMSEMKHRHDMERKMLECDVALNQSQINYVNASIDLKKRLQFFGFIITVLLIVLGFVCLILNRNFASVTCFVAGVASLCWVLFYGKKSNNYETFEKDDSDEENEK